VWEEPHGRLGREIVTPNGESLSTISLPGASLCADFLMVPETKIWAGVTVAVHKSDFSAIKIIFQQATSSFVKLIEPHEGTKILRYKDYPDWGWIEVNWLKEQHVEMVPAQTNQALWYSIPYVNKKSPQVVVLALEDIDYMLKEGVETMVLYDS